MTATASPEVSADLITSQRRRIRELEVMVAETIVETHDTATIIFFTGNDRLEYQAGHFLTLDPHDFPELERFTSFLEDAKGKKRASAGLFPGLLAARKIPRHYR